MPNDNIGIRNNQYSTLQAFSTNDIPYRRYTEGSSFRDRLRLEADVRSNSSVDISPRSRRQNSLSEDFQDSLHFSIPPQRTMSFTGGTNSLPAFLSGPPDRNPPALLQQMQSNQRAVENDYTEHPGLCPHATQATDIQTAALIARTGYHAQSRESSGRRGDHESSSRTRNSREEGTHPAFREPHLTTSDRRRHHRHIDFDHPPPRPPLSRFHFEHQRPGRALRISSSLPSSLTFNTGESFLVPMAHNPAPSRHHGHHGRGRLRTPDTMGHTSPRSHRGMSLTPPPVCRANKPRYDGNNRLIQTVSSPSVVTTQCVDSGSKSYRLQARQVPKTEQPSTKSENLQEKKTQLFQPTHVVISQQPRKKVKKKLVDDDDEISRQKKGLVVSLNNNVTKCPHSFVTVQSKDGANTMSSISSKMSDESLLKKEEGTPMLDATDTHGTSCEPSSTEDSAQCRAKSGDTRYTCSQCGKCTFSCPQCQTVQGAAADEDSRSASHCWMCNHRCLCNVDSCVETATCLCCVRGLFYHCTNYEDDDTCADKPCSCQSEKCCIRWTIMGALSVCLPCLCFYPIARGCVKLCRTCSSSKEQGCQCKKEYR